MLNEQGDFMDREIISKAFWGGAFGSVSKECADEVAKMDDNSLDEKIKSWAMQRFAEINASIDDLSAKSVEFEGLKGVKVEPTIEPVKEENL